LRILAQHLAGMDKYRRIITPEYARLIYLTSPLHDIGKVEFPTASCQARPPERSRVLKS